MTFFGCGGRFPSGNAAAFIRPVGFLLLVFDYGFANGDLEIMTNVIDNFFVDSGAEGGFALGFTGGEVGAHRLL